MAKYIIDIPDDRIGDFVGSTSLLIPYTIAGHKRHHVTELDLTPYTEPDRKAVDLQYARDIEKDDCWDGIYYECSVCKDSFTLIDGTPSDNNYNFCPNCGCDMREGEEE